jgi:hypothetical protein
MPAAPDCTTLPNLPACVNNATGAQKKMFCVVETRGTLQLALKPLFQMFLAHTPATMHEAAAQQLFKQHNIATACITATKSLVADVHGTCGPIAQAGLPYRLNVLLCEPLNPRIFITIAYF